jgi:hypothetical protein
MTQTKHRIGNKRYQFKPFEDESDLECICRLALRGRDVGAYLLRQGKKFSLVFGFRTEGLHTLLVQGQAEVALARLEEGLKGFDRAIGYGFTSDRSLRMAIDSPSWLI